MISVIIIIIVVIFIVIIMGDDDDDNGNDKSFRGNRSGVYEFFRGKAWVCGHALVGMTKVIIMMIIVMKMVIMAKVIIVLKMKMVMIVMKMMTMKMKTWLPHALATLAKVGNACYLSCREAEILHSRHQM